MVFTVFFFIDFRAITRGMSRNGSQNNDDNDGGGSQDGDGE